VSEYVQFAGTMVLFLAILIGSYWFVLYSPGSPSRRQREREATREREVDRGSFFEA
jgi:cbb3-type cytochrome oxidase subunit 3